MDIKVIGLCGVAQSGKDTFCNGAINLFKKQGIEAKRVSFADALKRDVEPFLMEKIGISSFTNKIEEKTLIRDFLVAYGTKLMRRIDENIWIKKAQEIIEENISNNIVSIVTDIRYKNEISWVQNDLGGVVLHITRRMPESSENVPPANKEEKAHDPVLQDLADRHLHWSSMEDKNLLEYVIADELDQLLNISED